MNKVIITPKNLTGNVMAVSSKSYAHRVFIAASLSDSETEVICSDISVDISTTIDCLCSMGSKITNKADKYYVTPLDGKSAVLNCNESGSTFRFLLPVAATVLDKAQFNAGGKLPERPVDDLIDALSKHSVYFSRRKLPFEISGKLTSGEFYIPGNVSSQYVSGLLMALPLLDQESKIIVNGSLQSESYVEMTREVLAEFSVTSQRTDYGYFVKGGQRYKTPGKTTVEGDWSNAAFFLTAGVLGSNVRVLGLNENSRQGDRKFLDVVKEKSKDMTDIPDLFPVLAVAASVTKGKTIFNNTARLRLKESDRIESTKAMLTGLGFNDEAFTIYENHIEIYSDGSLLRGGEVDSFNDHRIIMAAAIASTVCKEKVIINGAGAVAKSYPRFFEDFRSLGGDVIVDL